MPVASNLPPHQGARRRLSKKAASLAALFLLAATSRHALSQGLSIIEYPIPAPRTGPDRIVSGPDGALWFTQTDFQGGRKIGRMTLSGSVTEYPIPGANPIPGSIVVGPDGALWFEDYGDGQLVRLSMAGVMTTRPLPFPPTATHVEITWGPDGNLWYSMGSFGSIGRMTPQGLTSEFRIPSIGGHAPHPTAIVPGPDGALWFCDGGTGSVGRITTAGALQQFPTPPGGVPVSIAVGPDAALWVGVSGLQASLVRVDTAGQMQQFLLGAPFFDPLSLVAGRDGAIWFVDFLANRVGRLAMTGQLSWLDIPSSNLTGTYPSGITVGSDDFVWFTESVDNQIGRVTGSGPGLAAPPVPALSATALGLLLFALAAIGVVALRR